jgi:hypothetical protein
VDVSIIGGDALQAAFDFDRLVINVVFIPFELCSRVNCLSFSCESILVKDDNHFAFLSLGDTASSYEGNIRNLVIVNSANIDTLVGSVDDSHVVPGDSSVGSAIDE